MEDQAILEAIPPLLLRWYDGCARDLPWRKEPTPYRVWVSEIMLQQTRVEAVKSYYERFLEQLPTVEALAAAAEEQLMKLWEGLGYYSRARNLQKGARAVMERFGGEVPGSFEALRSLPGVGDYTAGAIGSIAFGLPVPAVDGNVLRVVSRLLALREDVLDPKVKKRTEQQIAAILPRDRPGDFNQSLMELGATVCLPNGAPECGKCPLRELCRARELGIQTEFPVKTAKKPRRIEERTVFLMTCNGRLALHRRPEKGLLAGLWELPSVPGMLDESEAGTVLTEWGIESVKLFPLIEARHVFTHVEWHMTAWRAEVRKTCPGFSWVTGEELEKGYALPSAFKPWFPEIKKQISQEPS